MKLITPIIDYNHIQYGKNGHIEYGWSTNIQEKILQFSFQITRTNKRGVVELSNILHSIISELKKNIEIGNNSEKQVSKEYLSILYKMIGQTRDVIDGKGECMLSYMMVYIWYKHFPNLALFALKCFVDLQDSNHQYGSWKDLKYFCEYCINKGENINSELIQYPINLLNQQLRKDYTNFLNTNNTNISLVAKWIPREKSKFGWMYEHLATNYFSEYLSTATTNVSIRNALLKCKTEYRKLISTLNKHIDTFQIKQCGKMWSEIDFNKVTSISILKQQNAFLNVKNNGDVRHYNVEDRVMCAENFNKHIERSIRGEIKIKGKRVGMADFTKKAFELDINKDKHLIELLNSQWSDNSCQNIEIGKMIAMVDVSSSMNGDSINTAIALGIRIAEKSILGNRIMTFSSNPKWVNLEEYSDFFTKANALKNSEQGMNTNFYSALDIILDSIIENKMSPVDVQDMVLVILSDMQIDYVNNCNMSVLYDIMKSKYKEAGIKIYGIPYKPPHILFWNLRMTNGFPCLANQQNVSFMSGFNPRLLNLFCNKGFSTFESCTPWVVLIKSLENNRYKIMHDMFYNLYSFGQ